MDGRREAREESQGGLDSTKTSLDSSQPTDFVDHMDWKWMVCCWEKKMWKTLKMGRCERKLGWVGW